ncbi:MAG TPA: ABC transporter transmembrane domain-containing protein [Pseudomonadales bacterium]|nr:ABC transporter transmembrane domain-containing protein [Pseudomonadales bacterium]
MKIFLRLRWYFRIRWKEYSAAIVMLTSIALLNLLPAALIGRLIDDVAQQRLTTDGLMRFGASILAVGLTVYVLRFFWRALLYSSSYKLAVLLREKVYAHLLKQPPLFFQRWSTGDLMARATNDVTAVEMLAGEGVLTLFDGVLTGLIVLTTMCVGFSLKLTLLALLPWPVMAYFTYRLGNALHDAFDQSQAAFSELNNCVQEQVGGIRTLKAYGKAELAEQRFAKIAKQANEAGQKVARVDAQYEPVISLTIGVSFFLSVAGGAWFIHQGQLTIGQLTSFTMYLTQLIWPMFAYGWLMNLIERGSAAFERIDQLLNTHSPILDDGQIEQLDNLTIQLDIDEFRYSPELPAVLKDIHLTLPAGTTLGIVGPTGSGKSTLVNLLLRFYEADGVSISVGGHTLAEYRLSTLRAAIACVPQDAFLFSSSIRENIALGRPGCDFASVQQAARIAAIEEDIQRFPDGYETLVGERGVTLSGGQKQRVGIARALLMNSPILILDDSLSAVDAATENKILTHFAEHSAHREQHSRIIVTHRLSAVENADLIIVLEHGTITERGTHEALIEQDGWYASTWRYQQMERTVQEGR